jgi:hypothetical protein
MAYNVPAALTPWQNFYVIVGSSAGALTGLQFVVIALLTQMRVAGSMREIRAFGTPTVIHFCMALFVSALMVAPWPTLSSLGLCLGVCGAAGIAYCLQTVWHARLAEYEPDFADWIWYTVLPIIGHCALAGAAILFWRNAEWSLALIAADALLFLFLGVHNSWDTVTYIAIQRGRQGDNKEP